MRKSTAIRAALLKRGLTPSSWAKQHGYDAETARRVMYRWAEKAGVPHGPLTRAILRDLSLDLGIEIPPGVDWRAAERGEDRPSRRVAGTH